MSRTDIVGTGGDKPPIHPMMAEITFLSDYFILVKGYGIIWTFLDTGLTPGTHSVIHDDNTVFSFADGCLRAGLGTGWFIAVPADIHLKSKIQVAVHETGPIFLNTNKFNPICGPVLLLAGHFTGFAAPAQIIVDG